MAIALVYARNNLHPDPVIDKQGSYKRGYVVSIVSDTHVFTVNEGPPTFEHVSLPGLPEDWEYLVGDEIESLGARMPASAMRIPELAMKLPRVIDRGTVTLRRFKVDVDNANQIIDMMRPV